MNGGKWKLKKLKTKDLVASVDQRITLVKIARYSGMIGLTIKYGSQEEGE